tara:strand:- start:800 stop:1042 length:243 start_codon:yes stop_codon:yes gene_type:complete
MKILLPILFFFLVIFILIKKVYLSAKTNLFKDHASWSNKEIKIKYNKSKVASESKNNYNYLQKIAEESEVFLEDQTNRER